jgi:hypothetical protein
MGEPTAFELDEVPRAQFRKFSLDKIFVVFESEHAVP